MNLNLLYLQSLFNDFPKIMVHFKIRIGKPKNTNIVFKIMCYWKENKLNITTSLGELKKTSRRWWTWRCRVRFTPTRSSTFFMRELRRFCVRRRFGGWRSDSQFCRFANNRWIRRYPSEDVLSRNVNFINFIF